MTIAVIRGPRMDHSDGAILFLGLLVAAGLGVFSALSPAVLAILPAAAIVVLLVLKPEARLLYLVVGGLIVLYSSQDLSPLKIAYLAGAALAFGVVVVRLATVPDKEALRLFRPLLIGSAALLIVVLLSFFVAVSQGTLTSQWLRDAAPYFLLGTVPAFALDARGSFSSRTLVLILCLAGMAASISFSIEFLGRRHFAQLPITHLGLSSTMLPVALLAYAASASLLGKGKRWRWTAVAALVLSLFLVTGTRSDLVFLIIPIAIGLVLGAVAIVRLLRLAVFVIVSLALVGIFTAALVTIAGVDVNQLTNRFQGLTSLVVDPRTDDSYRLRAFVAQQAWTVFLSSPAFGVGPGHSFAPEPIVEAASPGSFNIDTALSIPAKFGVAGIAAVSVWFVGYLALLRNLSRNPQNAVIRGALIGLLVGAVIWAPLGSPFEDKGFSYGLLLLLSVSLVQSRPRTEGRALEPAGQS